jgi:hypothetical protein
MLSTLLRHMGMPEDCNLHLEYKVKPPKGIGTASHTDLMVISGEASLAVEAKWTESRYDTVSKWLKKGSHYKNRNDVVNGWLSLLQKHAMHELNIKDFSDAIYQTVHRAASACANCKKPKMAYLVFKLFSDTGTAIIQRIQTDLKQLHDLLGSPSTFPFYVLEVHMSPTAAFKAIEKLPKGDRATAQQVSAALLGNNRLFSFEKLCVTRIGDKF